MAAKALAILIPSHKTAAMKKHALLLLTVLSLALALFLPNESYARGRASTAPGRYKDWNGEIDELTILQTFSLAKYKRIAVASFGRKGVEMPDKEDNTYAPVTRVLGSSAASFTEGLRVKIGRQVAVEQSGKGGPGTLIIRANVTVMNPGSQAARYFGGFGAGGAATGLSGELVDGGTKKVLVRFTQERRSGVGAFGGGYEDLLRRNLRQIGGDIGEVLKAF